MHKLNSYAIELNVILICYSLDNNLIKKKT